MKIRPTENLSHVLLYPKPETQITNTLNKFSPTVLLDFDYFVSFFRFPKFVKFPDY